MGLAHKQILKNRSWSLQRHLSPQFQDTPNGFSLNCDSNRLPTAHTWKTKRADRTCVFSSLAWHGLNALGPKASLLPLLCYYCGAIWGHLEPAWNAAISANQNRH